MYDRQVCMSKQVPVSIQYRGRYRVPLPHSFPRKVVIRRSGTWSDVVRTRQPRRTPAGSDDINRGALYSETKTVPKFSFSPVFKIGYHFITTTATVKQFMETLTTALNGRDDANYVTLPDMDQ